jgi:hypothetical protein
MHPEGRQRPPRPGSGWLCLLNTHQAENSTGQTAGETACSMPLSSVTFSLAVNEDRGLRYVIALKMHLGAVGTMGWEG